TTHSLGFSLPLYSVYYVFYEQYLNVVSEAIFQIGICLVAVTAVTFLLLGLNVAATAMVFLGVVYIVLSMLALMVLWNIDLNAISLVNLVVTTHSLGFSLPLYSVYYVFYEQYLNVVSEAIFQIGICLVAVTAVTFLLLGLNVAATAMVFLGVVYIVLSMLALMVLWNIDLNAISLVNLVVTIGIAVEFCAHIVRAFTVSIEPTRLARAKAALTNMGSSILRGITLTKLGGIIVLGSAKSRLFRIFYFRMYLGIIVFGVITGLIMIPVALSYIGPGLNKALAQKHTGRLRERDVIEHTSTGPVQHRGD
ncbi:Niemann-Pick C1 protein, partial [Paragonimus westermani]